MYKFDVLLSINSTFVVTAYSLNTFVLDNSDSLGDCGPFFCSKCVAKFVFVSQMT